MVNYADTGVAALTGRIVATSARCFKDGEGQGRAESVATAAELARASSQYPGGIAHNAGGTSCVVCQSHSARPCCILLPCSAGVLGVADKLKNPEARSEGSPGCTAGSQSGLPWTCQ